MRTVRRALALLIHRTRPREPPARRLRTERRRRDRPQCRRRRGQAARERADVFAWGADRQRAHDGLRRHHIHGRPGRHLSRSRPVARVRRRHHAGVRRAARPRRPRPHHAGEANGNRRRPTLDGVRIRQRVVGPQNDRDRRVATARRHHDDRHQRRQPDAALVRFADRRARQARGRQRHQRRDGPHERRPDLAPQPGRVADRADAGRHSALAAGRGRQPARDRHRPVQRLAGLVRRDGRRPRRRRQLLDPAADAGAASARDRHHRYVRSLELCVRRDRLARPVGLRTRAHVAGGEQPAHLSKLRGPERLHVRSRRRVDDPQRSCQTSLPIRRRPNDDHRDRARHEPRRLRDLRAGTSRCCRAGSAPTIVPTGATRWPTEPCSR